TTAASLWTTAGIGMAVGAGMYWGAFVAAAFLLVGLIILRHVESLFLPGKGAKTLYVTGRSTPEFLRDLERAVESHGAKFISLDFRRDRARDRLEVRAILDSPPDSRPIDLSNALRGLDAITEVEIR
ncbi:MAG: MgtC/SapB family protein, partial [Nitrospinota bacterium]